MALCSSFWYDLLLPIRLGKSSGSPQNQDICKPDIPALRRRLQKPLRPLWVTQASTLPHTTPEFPDFYPVILCTASRRVRGAEASEGGYVQGAADDHEAWSHGLTPALFWSNKDSLLLTNEEDLPTKIALLVGQDHGTEAVSTLIKPTGDVYVSASENVDPTPFDTVISCTSEPLPQPLLKKAGVKAYLHLPCGTGKLGSRDLRTQLPALRSLVPTASGKTLICCPTGKDLSVGAALAYLCLFVNEDGAVSQKAKETRDIDKTFIKQRLSWITTSNPALNPSRATLQSVNSVLMSSETPKAAPPKVKDPAACDSTWGPLAQPPTSALKVLQLDDTTLTNAEPSTVSNSPPDTIHPPAPAPASGPPPSLPTALFRALSLHPWTFTRTLSSVLPTHPSGTVTGLATFTSTPLPNTLLYTENGEFVTDTGLRFTARRRYVYELVTSSDAEGMGEPFIRVRFFDDGVRREDIGPMGEGVGGLFVEMDTLCVDSTSDDGMSGLVARNRERHLCGEDLYAASWTFAKAMGEEGNGVIGGKEGWWEVRYDVKGPRKDYVSTTRYRQGPEET